MSVNKQWTSKFVLTFVLIITSFLAPQFGGSALANESKTVNSIQTVTIPLTADCSNVPNTPQAKRELAKYNLCGYGHNKAGGVTPQGTVYGSCGSLSINVFNSNSGNMLWKAEMNSTVGWMAFASYAGDWQNGTTRSSGTVARSTGPNTGNWTDTFNIYTGAGYVAAKISTAQFTTLYGLVCYNNGIPTSGTQVN